MTNETPPKERPVIAQAPVKPITGTATVAVALKLPMGLILRYQKQEKSTEATPNGHRSVDYFVPTGEPFVLKGSAAIEALVVQGFLPDTGGFSVTPGCPKDLWDQWFESNKDGALVTNDLIRSFPDEPAALAWARTRGLVRSGLERIDPERPELTTGRRMHVNVTTILPGSRS
jgi:hypothetical protein